MLFYKIANDGYITSAGTVDGPIPTGIATQIDADEYSSIAAAFAIKPTDTEETWHRLREDLTWEDYPAPEIPASEDVDEAEAFDIIFGGAE